jgi:hypothetical protein
VSARDICDSGFKSGGIGSNTKRSWEGAAKNPYLWTHKWETP